MPCDYKKYPKNWFSEIRPAILERANNCCEFCGIMNYQVRRILQNGDIEIHNYSGKQNFKNAKELQEHLNDFCDDGEGKWKIIVLTIAHLDHIISNNDFSNLKALCQKCHINYDKKQHYINARATFARKRGLIELPFKYN